METQSNKARTSNISTKTKISKCWSCNPVRVAKIAASEAQEKLQVSPDNRRPDWKKGLKAGCEKESTLKNNNDGVLVLYEFGTLIFLDYFWCIFCESLISNENCGCWKYKSVHILIYAFMCCLESKEERDLF